MGVYIKGYRVAQFTALGGTLLAKYGGTWMVQCLYYP